VDDLRTQILDWCGSMGAASSRGVPAGQDLVHYAGRVFDPDEMCRLVESSLDFS